MTVYSVQQEIKMLFVAIQLQQDEPPAPTPTSDPGQQDNDIVATDEPTEETDAKDTDDGDGEDVTDEPTVQ